MTEEEQLRELNKKMETLIRLTAIYVFGEKKKTQAVGVLTELGFTQGEIASLFGMTVEGVKSARKRLKQRARVTRTKRRKDEVTSVENK